MHASATRLADTGRYQQHCRAHSVGPLHRPLKCHRAARWLPVCAAERRCRCYDLSQRQVPYQQVSPSLITADGLYIWIIFTVNYCQPSPLTAARLRCLHCRPGFGSSSWSQRHARMQATQQMRAMIRCSCCSTAPSTPLVRCLSLPRSFRVLSQTSSNMQPCLVCGAHGGGFQSTQPSIHFP